MHCGSKVRYFYWEIDCIILFLRVVVDIPIQTLIISPWLLFLELGLPAVRPDISKSKFMKIRSRRLNQFSRLKLKQQDQNVHNTINRYLRTDEFVAIRCDMKKGKKEEIINPLFHWGGQVPQNRRNIFPCFSDKRRQARSEHEVWVTYGRRSTKKEGQNQLYPELTPIVQAIFSPDTGGDYNKHGFMSRQHFLQRNDNYK